MKRIRTGKPKSVLADIIEIIDGVGTGANVPTLPIRPVLSVAGRTVTMTRPTPFTGAALSAWFINGLQVSGSGLSRTFANNEVGEVIGTLTEAGNTSISLPLTMPGLSWLITTGIIVSIPSTWTVSNGIITYIPGV